MTTNKKLLVGAAIAVGAYLLWKNRATVAAATKPTCGNGSFWKEQSDPTGYSPAVQAQIRMWGGFCAKQGDVSDVFLGGNYEEGASVSAGDVEDGTLITHPWQLP